MCGVVDVHEAGPFFRWCRCHNNTTDVRAQCTCGPLVILTEGHGPAVREGDRPVSVRWSDLPPQGGKVRRREGAVVRCVRCRSLPYVRRKWRWRRHGWRCRTPHREHPLDLWCRAWLRQCGCKERLPFSAVMMGYCLQRKSVGQLMAGTGTTWPTRTAPPPPRSRHRRTRALWGLRTPPLRATRGVRQNPK
jgi:hypothetical protein